MIEAQRDTRAVGGDGDVRRVVRVLHEAGPLPLRELGDEPALVDWPSERIEDAVVSAWSSGLIFIDAHDLLVAL